MATQTNYLSIWRENQGSADTIETLTLFNTMEEIKIWIRARYDWFTDYQFIVRHNSITYVSHVEGEVDEAIDFYIKDFTPISDMQPVT